MLYLLLFGPLLEPLVDQFGATNAYTFFVPGMLVQLGIFGAFFAGFRLIGEWREGVIEAERVTPASRTALLVGRLYRDLLQLLVQALILVGLGYALGMDASVGGMVLGVLLTLLIGGACAAASNALALTTKSEDVMAPVINMVMMPVLLLSGILLPMTIGPAWLERASDFMPIRHVVDARPRRRSPATSAPPALLWGTAWSLRAVRARALVGHLHLPQGEQLAARSRPSCRDTRVTPCQAVYILYGFVNRPGGVAMTDARRRLDRLAAVHPAVDRLQALPVAARPRGALAGLHRLGPARADRLGRVVVDRPDRGLRRRPG